MPQRLPRKMSWVTAFAIALVLAAGAAALIAALNAQRRSGEEITTRFENVLVLRRVLRLAVDAETGQRGYLLTGDRTFLAPYEGASRELPQVLSRLDTAGYGTTSGELRGLIAAKMDEMALTLRLADSGRRDEALRVVREGRGKRYLDGIRARLEALTAREQGLIATAIATSERDSIRTYILLAILAAFVVALGAFGASLLLRTQRLEVEADRLRAVEAAEQETRLIARELNHRVKNLFAVVLAIVQLAGRGATGASDAITRIRERVQALANAHEVSLGRGVEQRFELEALIRATLAPYARGASDLVIDGPPLELPVMRVTPLGMIIHELATNAVKHGAWACAGGTVRVSWSVADDPGGNDASLKLLRLCWEETCPSSLAVENRSGFGSRLIAAAVSQLGGRLDRERRDHGLLCTLDAPIVDAQAEPSGFERAQPATDE